MNVRLIVSILICLCVVLAGTIFFATRESTSTKEAPSEETPLQPALHIQDAVKKGVHTISGTITVSTPCVSIATDSSLDISSDPNVILIKITTAASEGVCLQIPDTKTFSMKITAPTNAIIHTYVDGSLVPSTS